MAPVAGGAGLARPGGNGYLTAIKTTEGQMTNPLQFISQVRAEIGKIAWPTRREVVTTSIMVVIFTALLAAFFSLVDFIIRFGYGLLLQLV